MQAIYPSPQFPTGVRATANGFATGVSRIGAAIGTYGAPLPLAHSTRAAMLVGGVIAVIGLLASFVLAPEINGMTLNQSSSADRFGMASTARVAQETK